MRSMPDASMHGLKEEMEEDLFGEQLVKRRNVGSFIFHLHLGANESPT